MQSINQCIARLIGGHDLSHDQILHTISAIARGYSCPAQIASFLTALHIKGASIHEAASIASAIQRVINPSGVQSQKNIFISTIHGINTLYTAFAFYMRNIGYDITISADTTTLKISDYAVSGVPIITVENNTYKTQLREFAPMKKILGFSSIVDEIQLLTPKSLCATYAIIESALHNDLLIHASMALGFKKTVTLTKLHTDEYSISLYDGLRAIYQEHTHLEMMDGFSYTNIEKFAHIVSVIATFIDNSELKHYSHFIDQVETKNLLNSIMYVRRAPLPHL